jgi:hypothetical protein
MLPLVADSIRHAICQRWLAIHAEQSHVFIPEVVAYIALAGAILPSLLCLSGPEHVRCN